MLLERTTDLAARNALISARGSSSLRVELSAGASEFEPVEAGDLIRFVERPKWLELLERLAVFAICSSSGMSSPITFAPNAFNWSSN